MNINKIKTDNIKYDNKGNKVTCTIKWYNPLTNTYQKSKGVAKCNPNDIFDLIKGQRIAESRAKIVMWRKYKHILYKETLKAKGKFLKLVYKELNHLEDLITK